MGFLTLLFAPYPAFMTDPFHRLHVHARTLPIPKSNGCGYFLATRKALKNKEIVGVGARKMVGKCRVIEGKA